MTQLATEKRYSKQKTQKRRTWQEISIEAKSLTGWKCCYPGCQHKASATHHACYQDKNGAIEGREIPGVHVFPLCDSHHDDRENPESAHHPANWYSGMLSGARLDARNRIEYYKLLVKGWDEKTQRRQSA